MGEMGTYTIWKVGEARRRRHARHASAACPDEVPPNWLVYFAVEDTDATLETVKDGGGEVRFGPIDIPAGRFAVITDPHGAVFAGRRAGRRDGSRRSAAAAAVRAPAEVARRFGRVAGSRPRPPIRRAGRGWRS